MKPNPIVMNYISNVVKFDEESPNKVAPFLLELISMIQVFNLTVAFNRTGNHSKLFFKVSRKLARRIEHPALLAILARFKRDHDNVAEYRELENIIESACHEYSLQSIAG